MNSMPSVNNNAGDIRDGLAAIWSQLLERTGPLPEDANLFDLGGSSLDVIRLISEVDANYGVSLEFSEVLENPTLGRLSAHLGRMITERSEPT